jgi:hypothetical protein
MLRSSVSWDSVIGTIFLTPMRPFREAATPILLAF